MEMEKKQTAEAWARRAGTVYAAAVLFWLPLYLYNGYLQLIDGKAALFYFFTILCGAFVCVCLARAGRMGRGRDLSFLWLLGLCAVYGVSTLLSPDAHTAFWGLAGRDNGFLMLLMCSAGYFIVKTTVRAADVRFLLVAFLAGAVCTAAVGWLNYFMCDPFDVYYAVPPQEGHVFLSTVGNTNFFGGLMAMSAPAALYACAHAEKKKALYGYGAAAAVLCGALIPAGSDGAWFGFIIAAGVLLCAKKTGPRQAARIFAAGGCVCLIGGVTGFAAAALPVRGPLRTFSALICRPQAAVVGGIVCGLLFLWLRRRKKSSAGLFRWLAAVAAAGLLLLLIAVNCTALPLGGLEDLLRFGPRWGSNRGYVWDRLCYLFGQELTPLQRLIGVGADGVDALLNPHYTAYITAMNGSTFDSAHNVYLQQLLCGGILGALCWCGFWAGRIKDAVKAAGFVGPVLAAYAVQAFFSIDMPAVLPLAFVLAALARLPAAQPAPLEENKKMAIGTAA
ncbi:MAG: O-antigen ligase family protein, partial [Oscillospiraceae bacterium]|nr:O-antigen ligase family protein [Oscillospiraceae bacterium]